MSTEILTQLRDRLAFKPKPSEHELARTHVRLDDVGIPNAIDDQVLLAMTRDQGALTVVVGAPGSGKSSLIAAASEKAISNLEARPILIPLKVPIAHHLEPLGTALLVKGITQSLATVLAPELSDTDRMKLERQLATTLTVTQQAPSITAGATGGFPFLKADAAVAFAGDLVTITGRPEWMSAGPVDALAAITDVAAAVDVSLTVVLDDTDLWSVADPEMADRARNFFSALRTLQGCPDIRLIVSVQTHWTETPEGSPTHTAAARREYQELAERADSRLIVPLASSDAQARSLIEAIIERRVEIALPSTPAPASGWTSELFTETALDLLAARCLQGNIRRVIADIRDAFEHVEIMPEKLDRSHLLDVIAE